jgi:Protein of unknown function (DUF3617)
MRYSRVMAAALAGFAAPAFAINFHPGYWQVTLTSKDGNQAQTTKGCLPKVKTQFEFDAMQKRYCKRLQYSVTNDTIVSKVHCDYPTVVRTSYEKITFSGDTLQGVVQIQQTQPGKQDIELAVSGKRLSATCPKAAGAATR